MLKNRYITVFRCTRCGEELTTGWHSTRIGAWMEKRTILKKHICRTERGEAYSKMDIENKLKELYDAGHIETLLEIDGSVSAWVSALCIDDFINIFNGTDIFDDGGIESRILSDCVWVCLSDICDYFGIDKHNFVHQQI